MYPSEACAYSNGTELPLILLSQEDLGAEACLQHRPDCESLLCVCWEG